VGAMGIAGTLVAAVTTDAVAMAGAATIVVTMVMVVLVVTVAMVAMVTTAGKTVGRHCWFAIEPLQRFLAGVSGIA
jgi:hypothetical protein